MEQIQTAILAGGASRRMGQDKASLRFGEETLLERVVRLASRATDFPVLVVGRTEPADWSLADAVFIPDPPEAAGMGPLGGIATALRHAEGRAVLALACDMPALTLEALEWLLAEGQKPPRTGPGVAVRSSDGQWEPLFAIYRPYCLPLLIERLATGNLALHRFLRETNFALRDAPPEVAAALLNINTPEELESWRSRS